MENDRKKDVSRKDRSERNKRKEFKSQKLVSRKAAKHAKKDKVMVRTLSLIIFSHAALAKIATFKIGTYERF